MEPIFDVEETNKELYDYVPELSEVRVSLHDNTLNSLLTPMLDPRWWGEGGGGRGRFHTSTLSVASVTVGLYEMQQCG